MKLPPLNALRAFDAAARHLNLRAASAELFVTPAAVSQQLRVLEDYLGAPLVKREPRGISLTEVGRSYHESVMRHIRSISLATERFRSGGNRIVISAVPSFGTRWLVPRLSAFSRAHPHIEVRLDVAHKLVDLVSGEFDMGIREGNGSYPDCESTLLFAMDMQPFASAAYIKRIGKHSTTKMLDWRKAQLLHDAEDDFWPRWLDAFGLRERDPKTARGLYFSHTTLALDTACQGEGVALASPCLVEKELAQGLLIPADERVLKTEIGYYLVNAKSELRPVSNAARIFRDWVIQQAQESKPIKKTVRKTK